LVSPVTSLVFLWSFLQSTKDSETYSLQVQTRSAEANYDIDHGTMVLVKILASIAMETEPGMTEDPAMQKEIRIVDGLPTLGRTRALRTMLEIHQLM
jgi:hypothetical protein